MTTLEQMLRWIALGCIFALPFIVFLITSSLFFPFITGKNFAFRIIVEIATGAYLALALVNPAYRPKRSWLLWAFALLVCLVALADLFGAYAFKSLWSNFERMDGWVTLVHLFLYFVVMTSILNTEKLWRRFWHVSLGVSVVVGLYGLLQVAGFASLNPGFSSVTRIDATFGNPIYLAVYMLFHIGIAAMLWSHAWAESYSRRRFWPSLIYGGIIALCTIILFMTGTRGAMLGFIGGVFLGTFLLALSSEHLRRMALTGIAGILVLAAVFLLVRDQAWVQNAPFVGRLATISLEDNTTKARIMNWGMAWAGVKERPLLGWGQENYAVVFDKYYNPQMYGQEQWFDRVHNIIFDWLIAAGFLGLLSYLSLFAIALWFLWRMPVGKQGKADEMLFSSLEKCILTGLLAAYFFHNLFVFDNILSYILFVSVLSYIAWRGSAHATTVSMPSIPRNLAPVAAALAVILVWGSAWYVNARPLAANRALLQALHPHEEGIMKNLEYFKASISYNTMGIQEAREQLVQAAAQVGSAGGVPNDVKQEFFTTAAAEMALMMEESPQNARFPLFLGALYGAYGDYTRATEVLVKAHELSPGKQTILFELGSMLFAKGDTRDALETYKTAYELAPEFLDARLYYAAVAIRVGDDALVDELLAPVIESGEAADPRIAAAYVARNRYDKIVGIWEARIKASPDDVQAYFTLAAAYYGTGNSSRAISTLQDVGTRVPSSKEEADALIEEIRSGRARLQ